MLEERHELVVFARLGKDAELQLLAEQASPVELLVPVVVVLLVDSANLQRRPKVG